MLVGPPCRKVRQIIEYLLGIRMENMRPIFMYQNAFVVVVIVGISANMASLVDNQDFGVQLRSQPLRKHAAGESRADNHVIKHFPCSSRSLPSLKQRLRRPR